MRHLLLCLTLLLALPHLSAQSDTPAKAPAAPAVATQTPSPPPPKPKPDPYPSTDQVAAAIKKALSFARSNLSFAGGYATKWSRDLKESRTSDTKGEALISIEAPGTPVIGLLFVRAWHVTGDKLYLQAARETAGALLWTQLASGGWSTIHDYRLPMARKQHYRRDLLAGDEERGERRAHSTLDDDKTQMALLFLIELAALPESKADDSLQEAVKFGLEALLSAQAPNGGWPQGFNQPFDPTTPVLPVSMPQDWPRTWPNLDYTGYYTINDGNLRSVTRVLTRAHQWTQDPRFLTALKKLGDFLLLAQCPAPQPGWAQQYNLAMEPAWARKFEPPCISSLETLSALETLHDIWLETGEEKYRAPFASALAWLEKVKLPDGQYARFQELHTDRPLYFVKDSYELTHDDTNLPTHYGFKIDDLQEDIDKFKEKLDRPRDEWLAKRQTPETPKAWLSTAKGAAKKVVTALDDQNKEGVWTHENIIEGSLIVKHLQAMITYLEAAQQAGPLFESFRTEENAKAKQK
jgi:hypothetical protein